MSYDGVQQLGQTQRDVGIVVRVRVRSSPFFKMGQNLLNFAELVLDVRKHCLGPQQDISWRGGRQGRKESRTKTTKGLLYSNWTSVSLVLGYSAIFIIKCERNRVKRREEEKRESFSYVEYRLVL